MRNDPGSNYQFGEEVAAASNNTGDTNGNGVDHANGSAVSFFISVGDVGASGTLDAKVQYAEASDFSDAVDDDGSTGNDSSITQLTAVGTAQLNVPNPRGRYSRVVLTVGANAVVAGVVSVLGPLRHVTP